MNIAREVAPQIGIAAACLGLGVARATFYRAQRPVSVQQANVPRASSPGRWAYRNSTRSSSGCTNRPTRT